MAIISYVFTVTSASTTTPATTPANQLLILPITSTGCEDFIVNGGFEEPSTKGSWSYFDKIKGWTSNYKTELGRGSIYNSRWGNTQVLELDSTVSSVKNRYIRQVVELKYNYKCELSFQHAARSGHLNNNDFQVKFNSDILKKISPSYSINTEKFSFDLQKGTHSLEFNDLGAGNSYGATIDNVKLLCCKKKTEC